MGLSPKSNYEKNFVSCFDVGELPRSPWKRNWNWLYFLPFIFTLEQCVYSLFLKYLFFKPLEMNHWKPCPTKVKMLSFVYCKVAKSITSLGIVGKRGSLWGQSYHLIWLNTSPIWATRKSPLSKVSKHLKNSVFSCGFSFFSCLYVTFCEIIVTQSPPGILLHYGDFKNLLEERQV